MSSDALNMIGDLMGELKTGSVAAGLAVNAASKTSSLQDIPQNMDGEEAKGEAQPKTMESAADTELEHRLRLLKSVGEECVTEPELRSLLKKPNFVLYDGFEPSGRMHIAQGVFKVKGLLGRCEASEHPLTTSCASFLAVRR